MNVQEILKTITYRDEQANNSSSIGIAKEVFNDFEMLPVKISKTGARRATIMLKNKATGKVAEQTLVMSPTVTDLFRAGKIAKEHIAGFPVFHGDKGFFVGLPSAGWTDFATIKVAEYVPVAVSHDEIASSGL